MTCNLPCQASLSRKFEARQNTGDLKKQVLLDLPPVRSKLHGPVRSFPDLSKGQGQQAGIE
jgi:hypothetical protein